LTVTVLDQPHAGGTTDEPALPDLSVSPETQALADSLPGMSEKDAVAAIEKAGLTARIVARDGDVLVVCEVKTRSSTRYGSPFEAITERKLHRLERLGMRWMRERGVRPKQMRVDIVSVLAPPDGRYGLAGPAPATIASA
jgi:hypothetical protein